MDAQRILAAIGDPKKVDAELQEFRKSAEVFSSNRPRLIDKYAKRWVAVLDGEVKADAESFQALLKKADAAGLPRSRIMVRYIDRELRTVEDLHTFHPDTQAMRAEFLEREIDFSDSKNLPPA